MKLLHVAPSWKLARNKQEEYACNVRVWANLFTTDNKDKKDTFHRLDSRIRWISFLNT